MAQYRVTIKPPKAEKDSQMFCFTRKLADEALKLMLDAGQPKGTKWAIYQITEQEVARGSVE